MSKLPSLFAQYRTDNALAKENILASEPSSAGQPPAGGVQLTAEAIRGVLAQKLSRKVVQKMQTEKMQKVEEVLPQFEFHLRGLDAQLQEFMEMACEKLEKLEEEKVGKDALKALEQR